MFGQIIADTSSSTSPAQPPPDAETAQIATAQGNVVVRPVREDLPKDLQDRVLPLKVRQEIWEKYFPNCKKQEGTEPLQLQIPRNKVVSLPRGKIEPDRQITAKEVYRRINSHLPCGIDIIVQPSADKRFAHVLLYIGLGPELRDEPQAERAIIALHAAWAILWPWARLANDGYDVELVKFIQWRIKNEIEAHQRKALDIVGGMEEALAFVKQEQIPRDESVAQSHMAVPQTPRPEPIQQQNAMLTDREALHRKLSAMREESLQDERVRVAIRVVTIITESRAATDNATLDWETLGDKLSRLVVESGHVGSRPRWIQESCSEWRRQNIAENSREQAIFDSKLNAWYSGILDFVRSQE